MVCHSTGTNCTNNSFESPLNLLDIEDWDTNAINNSFANLISDEERWNMSSSLFGKKDNYSDGIQLLQTVMRFGAPLSSPSNDTRFQSSADRTAE